MDFCKITAWQKFTLEFLKLSFGNGAIALRSGSPLLQAKKHDRKIKITDIAIEKIPQVRVPGLDEEMVQILYRLHREVLEIAQKSNDSNEVAVVYNVSVKISGGGLYQKRPTLTHLLRLVF